MLQASDFVPTPLAEDQGAITRFFNGNQPQKPGGKSRVLAIFLLMPGFMTLDTLLARKACFMLIAAP